MAPDSSDPQPLLQSWIAAWPEALACWSRFTKLSEPRWCHDDGDEKREGLSGSFAMIRLVDQAVVVSLRQVEAFGLQDFAREILAHEIGHHVYCPSSLLDQGRMLARLRRALPGKETMAPLIANLYGDLLINDRLQRAHRLRIDEVYRTLQRSQPDGESQLWLLYMRIYEILWSLQRGDLARGEIDAVMEGDAQLGARLIRSYARDWMPGAGRFGVLCLRYLLADGDRPLYRLLVGWHDTVGGSCNSMDIPDGLAAMDEDELSGAIHPADDPELSELGPPPQSSGPPLDAVSPGGSQGQYREPFEYGALLRSLGLDLSDHDIAVRYYRERALPHLVRFPSQEMPQAAEPLPEGLERWEVGAPLEEIDWLESMMRSPNVVSGYTTVRREWGLMEAADPERRPVDLDLYIDCSGSMPNPQAYISYLALAGAIVALSALRVGSRVQATLWSGARQFQSTQGFVSDPQQVLRIVTGYLGGGTAFPIHILRDTYQQRKPTDRRVHILIISDDGVTTMFDRDEQGNAGRDISRMALGRAGGGGTMVLQLWRDVDQDPELVTSVQDGWDIHPIRNWEDLVAFAQAFSRRHYGRERAVVS